MEFQTILTGENCVTEDKPTSLLPPPLPSPSPGEPATQVKIFVVS